MRPYEIITASNKFDLEAEVNRVMCGTNPMDPIGGVVYIPKIGLHGEDVYMQAMVRRS